MKKTVIALLLCSVSFWTFAQEAQEEPLGEVVQETQQGEVRQETQQGEVRQETQQEAGTSSSFYMGLWIETSSNNSFLIRDIATGEKTGFEFDRAAIYTKGNWWFWAEFASKFQLDAEIGVWEMDLPLYQANSFGGNVPDTTWTDGFQGLAAVLFAPAFGLNGQSVGGFNKLGFSITSPFLKTRFGYGLLKGGGMSSFTGIYNVIDRWDDVGRGYTEFHLGENLSKIGDNVKLDFFAALSRMRAEYGVYSLLNATLFEKANLAASFGSTTNSGELFRYNEQNENAFSFYGSYKLNESLKLALHGLTSFGTGIDGSFTDASAGAVEFEGEIGSYSADLIVSIAGPDVKTVWGDDDTVEPDSLSVSLEQWFALNNAFKLGLDAGMAMYNTEAFSDGLLNIRAQPMIDYNFKDLLGFDMSLSLYGVLQFDRIAKPDDPKQPWAFWFEEAGLEFAWNETPFMKKIVLDYALLMEYKDWNKGYDLDVMYNSIMLSGEINDKLSATVGTIIRTDDPSPLGLALGASIKTGWKFGAPRLWTHVAYGMDPYEDNNYTLFRADDPLNAPNHRTYMLKTLNDFTDKCRISIGLIWEL
jgi:hypothetical protein